MTAQTDICKLSNYAGKELAAKPVVLVWHILGGLINKQA